jgi:hypothetical protein
MAILSCLRSACARWKSRQEGYTTIPEIDQGEFRLRTSQIDLELQAGAGACRGCLELVLASMLTWTADIFGTNARVERGRICRNELE